MALDQWPVAYVALTDTNPQTLVAAPNSTHCIVVWAMYGSNGGAQTRVVFKDGTTAKFGWTMAANGGGFGPAMSRPWRLTAATALVVVQTVGVNADISVSYSLEIAP